MSTSEATAHNVFVAAMSAGLAEQPKTLLEVFAVLEQDPDSRVSLDIEAIEVRVSEEFPFLQPLMGASKLPSDPDLERWTRAVRWTLSTLQEWTWSSDREESLARLKCLLICVRALDVRCSGLRNVLPSMRGTELIEGLVEVFSIAIIHVMGERQGQSSSLRERLDAAAQAGDFEMLGQLLRHQLVIASSDFHAAVILLWKLSPSKLAVAVGSSRDVLKLHLVAETLAQDAPVFAAQVASPEFKFIAVEELAEACRTGSTAHNWESVLERLLLDIGGTEHWKAWMAALYKYPQREGLPLAALASSMAQLTPDHWTSFLDTLSLAYSKRAAQPVSEILSHFERLHGTIAAIPMWEAAFRKWEEWDYGRNEPNFYLGAPVSCALDFPVSKYYASLSSAQRVAEETLVQKAVDEVEMKWFSDLSELVTERNRLLSRLRLVKHGSSLTRDSGHLLPPPVQPIDDYTRIRYHYHDVQAP